MAIGAMAGLNVQFYDIDYGVDGFFKEVREINGRRCTSGLHLDYQLKATKNWEFKDEYIIYDLDVKNYNDLINVYKETSNISPLILILLLLPEEKNSWLTATHDNLVMQKCCYWFAVDEKLSNSNNNSKVRIKIPLANLLTPESLLKLLKSPNMKGMC